MIFICFYGFVIFICFYGFVIFIGFLWFCDFYRVFIFYISAHDVEPVPNRSSVIDQSSSSSKSSCSAISAQLMVSKETGCILGVGFGVGAGAG